MKNNINLYLGIVTAIFGSTLIRNIRESQDIFTIFHLYNLCLICLIIFGLYLIVRINKVSSDNAKQ